MLPQTHEDFRRTVCVGCHKPGQKRTVNENVAVYTVSLCTWQSLDELVHRHVIYQNAPFQKYINVQWMG